MTLAIRTRGDASVITNSVIAIVRGLDPALAAANIRTMEDVVSNSVAQRRVTMMLLSIFAGAALLLAAIGIYGVIAYSVTQRTPEIGLRMALGAQRGDVLRMVVTQAIVLALVGIVVGGAGALLLTQLMKGMLFQVEPSDPGTFASVSGLLAAVAVLASGLPACGPRASTRDRASGRVAPTRGNGGDGGHGTTSPRRRGGHGED
jgi:putative ABC transport system permease protein